MLSLPFPTGSVRVVEASSIAFSRLFLGMACGDSESILWAHTKLENPSQLILYALPFSALYKLTINSFETSCFVRHETDNTFSIYSSTEQGYGMSEMNQSFDGKSFFIGVLATFVVGLLIGANSNIGWNKKQKWEIVSKTIVSDIEKEVSVATGDGPPKVDVEGYEPFAVTIRPAKSPEVWYRKPVH